MSLGRRARGCVALGALIAFSLTGGCDGEANTSTTWGEKTPAVKAPDPFDIRWPPVGSLTSPSARHAAFVAAHGLLSGAGQHAFEALLGAGSVTTFEGNALTVEVGTLLAEPAAARALALLFEHGGPTTRIYALYGLWYADPPSFPAWHERACAESGTAAVSVREGCLVHSEPLKALIGCAATGPWALGATRFDVECGEDLPAGTRVFDAGIWFLERAPNEVFLPQNMPRCSLRPEERPRPRAGRPWSEYRAAADRLMEERAAAARAHTRAVHERLAAEVDSATRAGAPAAGAGTR